MPLILMSESDKNLIDSILEFNKTVLKCAIEEPLDVLGCIKREAPNYSPTFAAMQELGMGEFDLEPTDFLIDGIVVDEERAKSTPCKCVKFNGKDLCWSPGIIGLLKQSQIAKYCPTKEYEAAPKLVKHLEEFKKVAEETKGLPLLERIAIMKEELSKNEKKKKMPIFDITLEPAERVTPYPTDLDTSLPEWAIEGKPKPKKEQESGELDHLSSDEIAELL